MDNAVILAAVVLMVATFTDVRHRKIYNWLTYPTIVLGLLLACAATLNLDTGHLRLSESLLAVLGCGALMLVPYVLSGGGAGDVKLAMAIGSLVGFDTTVQGFCIGYIAAAVYVALRFAALALMDRKVSSTIYQELALRVLGTHATGRLFADRSSGLFVAAGGRIAGHLRRLGSQAEKPIPLAGFFATGMALLVVAGPLW